MSRVNTSPEDLVRSSPSQPLAGFVDSTQDETPADRGSTKMQISTDNALCQLPLKPFDEAMKPRRKGVF